MRIALGETFVARGAARALDDHLNIITSEVTNDGHVVTVKVTSHSDEKDLTCIIEPGTHPWVRYLSVVHYAGSHLAPVAALERGFSANLIEHHARLTDALLDRVLAGFASPHTPREIKALLRKQQLIA